MLRIWYRVGRCDFGGRNGEERAGDDVHSRLPPLSPHEIESAVETLTLVSFFASTTNKLK